jgi:mannose/cellobiose epimerase-like protein (N-acyl-D-glucosamine 2-epimerase family)
VQSPLTKFLLIAIILLSTSVRCGTGLTSAHAVAQELSRDRLLQAARAGGDYLLRIQRQDGGFNYYYDAAEDRFEARRYNIVRHAGTAVALFDLYAATRDSRYKESARRAMRFLVTRVRPAPRTQGSYVLDYDGKAKLGANGLALVALTRQIELLPASGDRRNAEALARLIVALQRKDGSFEMRYALPGNEQTQWESLYYPGEAMLGLIRLYGLNHDARLLNAARRGADYLIGRQQKMTELPADAWFMQALEALYNVGREKKYVDHALALAEAMIADQYAEDAPEGFAGGFGPGSPRATPAASRAEGLVAAYRLARRTGDGRAAKIAASLRASAMFQLAQQLAADTEGVRNPRVAAGGFREGLTSMKVRIDYVQHNISSLLSIAETLY